MHISMMDSLIIICAFLLLVAIDTGLAQQKDMYSQTSLSTSATPDQTTRKLDADDEGFYWVALLLICLPFVGLGCFLLFSERGMWLRLKSICRRAKKRLRNFQERHRPVRHHQQSECAPPSGDDQQPPLSAAPVRSPQPNQREIMLCVHSLNMRTTTKQWKRRPAPSLPIAPPPYSDVLSPPRRPAPPPQIPPPPYSDVLSPPRRPAPLPQIPPPSYSDVTSLPTGDRNTHDLW